MLDSLIPLWTLYIKEVKRFIKVAIQTIIGPAVSSLLFLAVFSLALSRSIETISGVNFNVFIAPGLIMMTILQNAFSNSASSRTVNLGKLFKELVLNFFLISLIVSTLTILDSFFP